MPIYRLQRWTFSSCKALSLLFNWSRWYPHSAGRFDDTQREYRVFDALILTVDLSNFSTVVILKVMLSYYQTNPRLFPLLIPLIILLQSIMFSTWTQAPIEIKGKERKNNLLILRNVRVQFLSILFTMPTCQSQTLTLLIKDIMHRIQSLNLLIKDILLQVQSRKDNNRSIFRQKCTTLFKI